MLLSVTARPSAASHAKEFGGRYAAAADGGACEGVLAKGEVTSLFSQSAARGGVTQLRRSDFFRGAVAFCDGSFFSGGKFEEGGILCK